MEIIYKRKQSTKQSRLGFDDRHGRLLALPANIGWKGLPGTNALAYYEKS